ncbi:hypothetical protein Ait01nite_010730 [Actinoplanes italicus]|uniref:Uncharacterized protein DUF3263 n=2 Tax=Actinoplanes italicus TaxID=113567 RepID=A0A2T0KKT2_9ACTN|nr:uncharacterized protein DUF3263 [Actinoplanes italicus]GIE28028.1 hypothetical protein Ait01nite_010730 [Actinoplanes italicus]
MQPAAEPTGEQPVEEQQHIPAPRVAEPTETLPPTALPAEASPTGLPAEAPPTRLPAEAPPTGLPAGVSPATLPAEAQHSALSAGAPPTALPADPPAAAPVKLTDRELEILAFEAKWWKHAGAKEQAIRDTFALSSTRYYQLLNALLDNPAALERDPVLVGRLRRLRSARARTRRR